MVEIHSNTGKKKKTSVVNYYTQKCICFTIHNHAIFLILNFKPEALEICYAIFFLMEKFLLLPCIHVPVMN